MDMLDHALVYASSGRPVFPVKRDKKPLTEHGFKDATTDKTTIREWFTHWRDAGAATPTGDGWFVLDVDVEQALLRLEAEHGPLPPTRQVVTPRPGRHIYLRGDDVTNADSALPEGIHVRGIGGYVLLPPSPHENGGTYEWRDADLDIAPAPAWLLDLLKSPGTNGHAPAPAVEGDIPEHQRHIVLVSLAGTMRRRGMRPNEIEAALLEVNKRCKPPHDLKDIRRIASDSKAWAAEADAVPKLDELNAILGFEDAGRQIDCVKTFGRGTDATVHIELDDGKKLILHPVGRFATAQRLTAELALTVGVTPTLKATDVTRALALIHKLGEHHDNVEIEDRAADLGRDYLRAAYIADVVMADQASRWEAFVRLDGERGTSTILWDHTTGMRYVRLGSFASYVREHTGTADPFLRAMPSIGWHRRGAEGQIKATRPGFDVPPLKFRFFEVPEGWE